jgi:outer membrane protein OmpA-like peptidoglycan-associated protein
MRFGHAAMLYIVACWGCSSAPDTQQFSVFFQPYSAAVDQQATATIEAAAVFAQAHPAMPVTLNGYSAPPDPKLDVDGLSAQRAEVVKKILVTGGVSPGRVTTRANGITDPKSLPNLSVRRVDINIGP